MALTATAENKAELKSIKKKKKIRAMLGGKWELSAKLKYFKSQVSSIKATLKESIVQSPFQGYPPWVPWGLVFG